MNKRRYGRTDHMSTLAIFGAVALGQLDQPTADQTIQQVLEAGINHFDVAPSYGKAELRLGPWMDDIRDDIFLGCKTTERSQTGALKEFHDSLQRLQINAFDLYQLHAITTMEELNLCTKTGGALEGIIDMREQGLTRFIGITGHGLQTPEIFIEALSRFDFDSVLFPIYPALFSIETYRIKALELLDICEEKDVGVMTIKAAAKKPWGNQEHKFHTWYAPFENSNVIQENINFVLSHKLTHICTPGDFRLLEMVLNAVENFSPISPEAQKTLSEKRSKYKLIF